MQFFTHARILVALLIPALIFSCKKKDDDPSGGGGDVFQILNTDKWTVAGSHSITYNHGNTSGAVTVFSLARQSADELRWNVGISAVGNSIQKPTDIILTAAGSTSTRDLTNEPPFPTPLLVKAQGAEWKVVERDAPQIFDVLRNNQSMTSSPQDPNDKENAHAAEDGFFITGTDYSTYEFSFFNFATQAWKRGIVVAERAVPLRYGGTTYVVGFNFQYDPANPELRIFKDTGSAMQLVKKMGLPKPPYFITSAITFGKYALVVTGSNLTGDAYYKVYKIDLEALSIQVVQEQTAVQPYSYGLRFAEHSVLLTETDEAGNLYAIENRIENQQGHYSIRRYNVAGGAEVVLEESDLKERSVIHALRWFNGKLYAAVSYREESGGTSTWHLQLIRLK